MIQITNQRLTEDDVKKIDREITSHKCDSKYLVEDEQNPEWRLMKCVMCGLRITIKKRVCKNCNHPYSGVYKLQNFCNTCSGNKILGDFKEVEISESKLITKKKGGPFYE